VSNHRIIDEHILKQAYAEGSDFSLIEILANHFLKMLRKTTRYFRIANVQDDIRNDSLQNADRPDQ
jgi:hypothetical protein